LVLYVDVVLLHHSLLEVAVLRKDVATELAGIRGLTEKRKETCKDRIHEVSVLVELTGARRVDWAKHGGRHALTGCIKAECLVTGGQEKWTLVREKGGEVRFCKERWVFPEALPALIPRRVVKNRVARTNRRLSAAKRLPSQTDPGLESSFVPLDADARVGSLSWNQKSSSGEVKVCLTILSFRDRRHQSPCQPQVQG